MTPNPDPRLTRGLMRRQARRPVILATGLFSVAGLLAAGAVALPAAPADAAPSTPSATTLAAAPAATAPGAPTNVAATAGDEQATVTFTAPASDGGSPITGYAVTATDTTNPANGGQTAFGASPLTVTGLTNGDSYTFTVTALNVFGPSPASAPSNAVTPSGPAGTIPGAPTNVTATAGAGDGQATVTFTAPASDGGAPITGYTVTATDTGNPANGGQTATGTGSPLTVTGLTNGDSYTFTVTAVNAIGTGPASPPSNPVTPTGALSAPGAPTNVAATAGDGQATVTFTAPASDGGLPITGYAVTATDTTNPANGGQTAFGASPLTVTGLTNGDSYTFTVTALNVFGPSPASAPSNAVTPTAPVTTTAPGAPTIGTATAGDGQATVTFTAPASDGGSTITGYTVTATDTTNPANGAQTATGTGSPLTVTGLINGDSYTFTVTAVNAVGTSPASAGSNPVTPTAPVTTTIPGAPTNVNATAGNGQATVTFTAPASDGGSPITQYEILANDITDPADSVAATATGSPTIVTGLDNGDTYDFIITASNAIGTGPASVPSNTVTPTAPVTTTAPGAPTNVNATAGNGQATVTFTAPASDGGSPITGYTVLATDTTNPANGGQTATGTGSPLTVTGLINGDSYTFTVTAVNAVGTSPASAGSNPVTPTAPVTTTIPGAPTNVNATAGNGQATVTFTAPASDGGSPITRYTVTATDLTHRNHGGQTATGTGSPITIRGLTDGDRYTFTVTATNAIGTSHASTPSNTVTPEPPAKPTADLSVAISQHPPVRDGETFTERVTVTDHGPSRATGIDTVIAVPAQFVIVSDQGGRKTGQDVTWDGASLGAGQSVTYTVTIRVSGRASGVAILTATTSSARVTDPDRRNNTAITAIRLG